MLNKIARRQKRKVRVKTKIKGIHKLPRLIVHRSHKRIYAQLIDNNGGKVIAQVTEKELKNKGTKTEKAFELGNIIGTKIIAKKIDMIVFDRSGYKYHGRIKSLADGARKAGLKF